MVYARTGNPTWTAFETALGDLEGGDALVLSSGMAAVAAALSLLPHGATVVAPDAAYNGVVATLADREAAGSADRAPGRRGRHRRGPGRPRRRRPALAGVADQPAARGRRPGRPCSPPPASAACCRWSTTPSPRPLLQRPLELGADVVVHSVTKYLSGHSDVLLGAVVTPSTDAGRAHHDRLLTHRTLHGAIAGPMEVWLALRGLRTLPCGWSGRRPTPSSSRPGWAGTRPWSGCGTRGSAASSSIEVAGGARGRRAGLRGAPGSGCTRRASAGSRASSSGAGASRASRPRCPRT